MNPVCFFPFFFSSFLFHELKYCGDYVFCVHHLIHCLTFTRNLASSKITEHISNKSGIAIFYLFIVYLFYVSSSFLCVLIRSSLPLIAALEMTRYNYVMSPLDVLTEK